ncbi:MAG: PAS domain S-box protein, partial [Melioribacteraceae bacterium]
SKIVGLANHTILISKKGQEIPIADSGAPIHDNEGNIKGVVLVIRDQNKERESQKALRESEEIFSQFMKYSHIYVFFKDKDIRSIRLSKNYEKMLGKPIEELLGKNMFELFPSEFAAKMVEDDKKILNEGKIIEVVEELNGRIYSTIKFPIHHDGKPEFLAGFTIDITESKKAEEALQNSERNLREIYNSTNEAIFLHEADKGKVIDVNETMIRMFGYNSKEEVLNASFEELNANIPPYDYITAINYLKKALTEGPHVFEWLGKKKNGDFIWLEVSLKSSSIGGGGKILAVARDITERKKTEENLREVTELQKAILENASYAIISTNAEGVIRSFNPAAEKITGYAAADVINKYTPEIFHDPAEIFERAKLFSKELGETVHPG